MKIKKCVASNHRKRTLRRNKVRLANRRLLQFMLDKHSVETSPTKASKALATP